MPEMPIRVIIAGRILCRQMPAGDTLEGLALQVDRRHKLKLRITRFFKNTKSLPVEYEITEQTKVLFDTTSAIPVDVPTADPPPTDPDPKYLFRHIMNLDNLHGAPVSLIPTQSHPPSATEPRTTYFRIGHAKCYAQSLSKTELEIWKHTKKQGPHGPEPFNKEFRTREQIGNTIGADYKVPVGNQISITLRAFDPSSGTSGPQPQSVVIPFPYQDNVRYEILLDNSCTDRCELEDFWLYYRLVKGDRIEIETVAYPPDRPRESEASCNVVTGGGDPNCDWEHYAIYGTC